MTLGGAALAVDFNAVMAAGFAAKVFVLDCGTMLESNGCLLTAALDAAERMDGFHSEMKSLGLVGAGFTF